MKKLTAMLMSFVLAAALAIPALGAAPFYLSEETSPYDNCEGNRSCPMWYFSDLEGSSWYHDGVHYCLERMMIVGRTGPEDSSFDPSGSLTRDDLVRTLYRSAAVFGTDVSVGEDTNILSYDDFDKISEYAIPAMQWACGSGLLIGEETAEGKMLLNPRGETTRAQLSLMLMRFDEWMK